MKKLLLFFSIFSIVIPRAYCEKFELHIPIISDSPNQHLYYHDLLETALKNAGHEVTFVKKTDPQSRTKKNLEDGILSLYWMVASSQRDKDFIPIKIGLTNGLIGKRILFIKKGDQPKYDGVKTLDDFRKLDLVGGMGSNWFDVKVWKANNLKYKEQSGNWKSIFKMIPKGRRFNYFSRGINEIITESKQYPDLLIEKNLVLIYDRDFRFYLSKSGTNPGAPYRKFIEEALKKAKADGVIEQLVRKYWHNDFKTLNYDTRIKINLSMTN